MKNKTFLSLCVALAFVCLLTGCEEKRKALVSAHTAMGELLLSTKSKAQVLHTRKIISEQTYQSIRTNWLRAQISYLTASDMLERILDTDSQDITAYTELITQVSTILSDIALWLEEDRNEPTSDHIVSHPTPTPYNTVGDGNIEDTRLERIGQRVAAASRAGDEGQSVSGDLGKLKFSMSYSATYKARQEIFIHGIKDNTAEVRVTVLVGNVVYTLDGSEPVLTDGVPYLGIHQSIALNASQARQFRAKSSMDGTQLTVLLLENE